MKELIIGSHVSYTQNEGLIGSVNEALSYNANTFMFYTGAPQNTLRAKIDENKTKEAQKIMKENMYSAHRTDNGEIISGYYFARPNDPTGPKDFIVTAGSAKWIEIDPATLKPMPTKHAVSQE